MAINKPKGRFQLSAHTYTVDSGSGKKLTKKERKESLARLAEWQDKWETAWNAYDTDQFDRYELTYLGNKETTRNINSRSEEPIKRVNNVANVSFEYTESQTSIAMHDPVVKSRRRGYDFAAKMIQEKIKDDFECMHFDEELDLNERNTVIHGISATLIDWDYSVLSQGIRGEKRLINLHAKNIIPQPSVYKIQDMDYFFIAISRTKKFIRERYGVDVTFEEEEYPEINQLEDITSQRNREFFNNLDPLDDKVTEITAYYKDEDGDIGKFVYAGDTVLEDLPKYYYPRVMKCKECEDESPMGSKECISCKAKGLSQEYKTEEMVTEDMDLRPITYKETKHQVMEDEMGNKTVEEVIEDVVVERNIKRGTMIPIYAPKMFPIAIRLNVPQNFEFRGQSDIDKILDQQESIKKTVSKIEEIILNGGSIVAMPTNIRNKVTSDAYQIVRGSPADLNGINVHTLEADIVQKLAYFETQKQIVKDTLGITESFQGKADPTAKSGIAKELQVAQAAGRLASKRNNKRIFFRQLFNAMFWLDMTFTREPRPYTRKDNDGRLDYGEFNKYELLMEDNEGNWVYNLDFMIDADNNTGLPQDSFFVYQQGLELYGGQVITQKQLLELMAELNFPMANRFLSEYTEMADDTTEEEEMLARQEEILAQLSPEEQAAFQQLPPGQQMDFLMQAIQGGMAPV